MLDNLLPFKSHYLDRNGNKLHYINEGQGEPVVMVHGNPSWSYYYRNLVSALSDQHQCIVPDHIGCGLSDKPDEKQNITLVVHDWGGMIGMGFAARHPERIKRIVCLNTAAFHLPKTKPFPWALWICRETLLGTLLVRGLNAFSSAASYVGVKRKPMSKEVREAYVAPFDSWKNRISTLRFVQDIPLNECLTQRCTSLLTAVITSLKMPATKLLA